MRRPQKRPNVQLIGNNSSAASYFDIFHSNTFQTALVWFLLLLLVTSLIVVIAAVPDYNHVRTENGPTRTYPPHSTTIVTTASTTDTTSQTPTPTPSLVLTCPSSDVSIPLGYPIDNVALGGVSLTGGCEPLSLTYVDTVVGNIAKRNLPSSRGTMRRTLYVPQAVSNVSKTLLKSVQAIDHGKNIVGNRCGIPMGAKKDVVFSSRSEPKSPSYPNGKMSAPYTRITSNTNAPQPNPSIDTNVNFVVSSIASETNGATIHVYTKALLELGGSPFTLSSLAPDGNVCKNTGNGQAQVLFDTFANIWVFVEPSTSNQTTLCLYASDGSEPLTSTYTVYALTFPSLDGQPITFPKIANFNNYYTVSMLHGGVSPVLVIIKRESIITQQLSVSYFTVPAAFPPQPIVANTTYTPLDNRGETQVPSNISTGVFFMRQKDTGTSSDFLDVIEYTNIDFDQGTASESTYSIQLTSFDSSGPSYCIPVPGGSNITLLYAGQEWLGGRLSFRTLSVPYDNQYRVVGTFVTEACIGGRIQWFELEFNFGTSQWIVRQQGVTPEAPPEQYLWMPAISEDKYGNIVIVFSNSSTTALGYYPSLGAYTRVADDPLNTLRVAFGPFVWGGGQSPSPAERHWGYSSDIVADPAQSVGRSFYAVGSYSPGTVNVWQALTAYLRITGDIIQRQVTGQDLCGQIQSCQFFILDGNS